MIRAARPATDASAGSRAVTALAEISSPALWGLVVACACAAGRCAVTAGSPLFWAASGVPAASAAVTAAPKARLRNFVACIDDPRSLPAVAAGQEY